MFCMKCGQQNADGAMFCVNCGEKFQSPIVKKVGMGWANFLGYFALWFGALINLVGGIACITGSQYGSMADAVYEQFAGLKLLDSMYGTICVAVAVFGVVCAISVIQRKKIAITIVPALYVVAICVVLIYCTIATLILNASCFSGQIIVNICVDIVMIVVNITYFKNRTHVFVN